MPIPQPNKNESEPEFMNRCMGDPIMVNEYPEESQRAAICHSSYRENKKKND